MRIDEPEFQSSYEYEDYDGSIEEKEPESGGQWAFVNAWVKNESGQTEFSPSDRHFSLVTGSSQFDGETLLFEDPIDKGEAFDGGELQPGIEREGWIAYEVPDDLSTDDVTMAWSKSSFTGEVSVSWTSV